jgi:hypothetical protein
MWNIGPIQIQAILYIHKNTYKICPKEGLVVDTERGKERKRASENKIHDICVGTRYKETQC